MERKLQSAICILVLALLIAGPALAQPQQGQRLGSASTMGRGSSAEQLLGTLAFDEKIDVTDDQLLKLRSALKMIYGKQQDMAKKLRGGSREGMRDRMMAMRTEMMALRTEMMETVETVLNEKQLKQLKEKIKKTHSRRGGRQGRSARQRGGGRN